MNSSRMSAKKVELMSKDEVPMERTQERIAGEIMETIQWVPQERVQERIVEEFNGIHVLWPPSHLKRNHVCSLNVHSRGTLECRPLRSQSSKAQEQRCRVLRGLHTFGQAAARQLFARLAREVSSPAPNCSNRAENSVEGFTGLKCARPKAGLLFCHIRTSARTNNTSSQHVRCERDMRCWLRGGRSNKQRIRRTPRLLGSDFCFFFCWTGV